MSIQFPANPVEGTFHQVTAEKKYQFVNGAWKLHTNNLPVSSLSPVPVFPPVVANVAPALTTDDAFWYDADDKILYFKKVVDNVPMWEATISSTLPLVAAVAPALTTQDVFWYNSATSQMYFKQDVAGVKQWTKLKSKASSAALATSDIDVSLAELYTKTITAPTTFSVSNVPPAGEVVSFILELTNGGAFAITWFANIKWTGGKLPTLTAAGVDVLGFYSRDGGATWRGFVLSADSKGVA